MTEFSAPTTRADASDDGDEANDDGDQAVGTSARSRPLETLLRGLKLPGMADMLGERLAQTASAQLGHVELLALLCGDELARRDAAGLARRLAAARFKSHRRDRRFRLRLQPRRPRRDHPRPGHPAVPRPRRIDHPARPGRGRQDHARPSPRAARLPPRPYRGVHQTSRLLADLAGGHADHTWATRLRRWARPALLICDDFAMRELSMPTPTTSTN